MSSSDKPKSVEVELRKRTVTLQREVDRRALTEGVLEDRLASQTRRLAESDQLFRMLVESIKDYAIFMLDPAGNVATWNAGAQHFKGYEANEIIGRHFSAFYPAADIQAGKCELELEGASRTGRHEDEGWRLRKDGTRFWASVVITAIRDAAGELVGFAKVTRDLTERKRAENRRRTAEERFRLLVESLKDYAIFLLDPGGNIATWNTGAERIKGYRAEEVIGSHFSRFYPEVDIRAGKCEHELEVASREGRFEDEGWRLRKDGTRFWANVVISAIHDEEGHLVGFSKVTRDLTDRRRSEDERAARLAAEEANRTKDEFLAMLGHELRNPLAPIVSALQLLKLRGDTSSVREHQVIERQVRQMIRLVDDLLDVSRVSRGKVELKKQPMDLRDALAKAVEIAIPQFEKNGQQFEVEVPPRPLVVAGDEGRLVQVFANLLTNAAKYTQAGGHIVLRVRPTDRQLEIEVRDDGHGISLELLPRVFDLFVQGYQDVARAEGGLGLGLTLVRSLVEMHGGEVEAHSAGPKLGSTFVIRLPMLSQPLVAVPEPIAVPVSPSSTKRRILVVDDNEDARLLLAEMLAALGHEVQTAGDGPSALAVFDQFVPDVAILDIGLPGMDGYEVAERIRKAYGTQVRLLALSGYGQASDRARGKGAGFDVHLVKPVDVRALLGHIVAPIVDPA
ncbi:MAG: PAS domain S-box protein [Kofleriaceae bacterium]